MDSWDHKKDIPIWFNGTQRWMTGLTKRTTCDDVIYAILYSSGLHEDESTDNYAIFEKWREVERPLSARAKILKVWSVWAEEQKNVSLSMRSLSDYFVPGESSLYMRSRRRHKRSSRQRSRHSTNCKCHDRHQCGECSRLKSLEQLVKLVVTQERRLQDIAGRISDTDSLIERHEGRIHDLRVKQNGLDYVQESYLNSHSSGSSSSLDSACVSVATLDLNEARRVFPESSLAELGEITRMCDQLVHLERRLAVEKVKAVELEPEVKRLRQELGDEERNEEESAKNEEVEEARSQLLRAVTNHVTQEYNERLLDRRVDACVAELEDRQSFLSKLQDQLFEIETRLSSRDNIEDENSNTSDQTQPGYGNQIRGSPLMTPHQNDNFVTKDANFYKPFERGRILSSQNSATRTLNPADNQINKETGKEEAHHSSLAPAKPVKSMTGRGRFAKNYTRNNNETVSTGAEVTGPQTGTHLLAQPLLHESATTVNIYNDQNAASRAFSPAAKSVASYHPSLTNAASQQRNMSPNFNASMPVDNTNVDIASNGNTPNNGGSFYATNFFSPQRPVSMIDHSTTASPSSHNINSTQSRNQFDRFARANRSIKGSIVNAAGSLGDLTDVDNYDTGPNDSHTNTNVEHNRTGRGRAGNREVVQSAMRRSRSADRDRSSSQGRRRDLNPNHLEKRYNGVGTNYPRRYADTDTVNKPSQNPTNKLRLDSNDVFLLQEYTDANTKYGNHSYENREQNYDFQDGGKIMGNSYSHTNDRHRSDRITQKCSEYQNIAAHPSDFGVNSHNNQNDTVYSNHNNYKRDRRMVSGGYNISMSNAMKTDENRNNKHQGLNSRVVENGNASEINKTGRVAESKQITQEISPSHLRIQDVHTSIPSSNITNRDHTNGVLVKDDAVSSFDSRECANNGVNKNSNNHLDSAETDSSSRGALYHILSKKRNASKDRLQKNQLNVNKEDTKSLLHPNQGMNKQSYFPNHEIDSGNCSPSSLNNEKQNSPSPLQNNHRGRSFVLSSSRNQRNTAPIEFGPQNRTSEKGSDLNSHSSQSFPYTSNNFVNGHTYHPSAPTKSSHNYVNGVNSPLTENPSTHPDNSHKSFYRQADHLYQLEANQHPQPHTNQPSYAYHHNNNPTLNSKQTNYYQNHSSEHYNNSRPYNENNSINSNQQTQPDEITPPYRRSALNPHFCDIGTVGKNKAATKFSVRTPTVQQPNKPITNGSTGLINYRNNGIISSLSHQQTNFNNEHPTHPYSNSLNTTRSNMDAVLSAHSKTLDSGKSKMEDSNDSDTGISSMHSDETTNMETLV